MSCVQFPKVRSFSATFNQALIYCVEFADPPPAVTIQVLPQVLVPLEPRDDEPVVPTTGAPTTLMQWAVLILNTPNPTLKVCYSLRIMR